MPSTNYLRIHQGITLHAWRYDGVSAEAAAKDPYEGCYVIEEWHPDKVEEVRADDPAFCKRVRPGRSGFYLIIANQEYLFATMEGALHALNGFVLGEGDEPLMVPPRSAEDVLDAIREACAKRSEGLPPGGFAAEVLAIIDNR